MREVAGLGIYAVEASADTELDPLYLGPDYLSRWQDEVREAALRHGCSVANLYSGHGTYATLGLSHTDHNVRTRFLEEWLKPMLATAASLGAGMGFYTHAFPQSVLADPARFEEEFDALAGNLAEVARYHAGVDPDRGIGVEQMYTPHQVPWTITQARELLSRVYRIGGAPFHLTIDVGHQSGQHRFRRPTAERLAAAIAETRSDGVPPSWWIGPDPVVERVLRAAAAPAGDDAVRATEIAEHLADYPYLYSEETDSDPYAWLRTLGTWSPIIHLQQTDGTASAHLPFNEETNKTGIIEGRAVLEAIRDCYVKAGAGGERNATVAAEVAEAPSPPGAADALPPPVRDIYLTIEIFARTADTPEEIRIKARQSAAYWRQFIPKDGMTVDALLNQG
jgi:sugar phosphate isomerase/epimerase